MFPNPQDALPVPARPNLERYKKLAKDLAKAASSADESALHGWTTNWIESLIKLADLTITPHLPVRVDRWIADVEEFAISQKTIGGKLPLTKSQFVLARSHGFESWTKFAKHLEALARAHTPISNFERAAEAIITGDLKTLESLLRKNPALIRARSTRERRATLLHYVSANGVEGYRQKTPPNAAAIANLLLDAGADVNSTADVYGGGATTLMLAATSSHPDEAGVQGALLEVLLEHGASLDQKDDRGTGTISACLANGRPRAAKFLADRGAELDLEAAAGLGLLEQAQTFFDSKGILIAPATRSQLERGFLWACEYGHSQVAEFLLDRGVNIQADASTGQTALHFAVLGAHPETICLLLAHGANLETKNSYGGTALGQALWCAANIKDIDYLPVIEVLINAGSKIEEGTSEWISRQKELPPQLAEKIHLLLTQSLSKP